MFKPSMPPEAVEKALRGLSPGEAVTYRLGAAEALRATLANQRDGTNKVAQAFGSPAIRAKIAAMMRGNPEGHADFVRYLANEGAMFTTRQRSIGGSQTAERLENGSEQVGQHIAEALHAAKNLAHGNLVSFMASAARHLMKVNPELRGQVLDEARRIVLNPDPEAVRAFVKRVNERRR